MTRAFAIIAAGLFVAAANGCDALPFGSSDPPPQYIPPTVPPAPLPGTQPAQPGQQIPTMPVAPAPVPVPPGQAQQFVWTETPAFNQIPATPAAGMANGRPFTAAAIVFEPGPESWRMIVRDQPITTPTAVLTGGQSINLDLPGTPETGANWMRPMEYGGGYFQIGNDPANPDSTTSWNADNAWAVEITQWQAADYNPDGPLFQQAGVASGRVAVCYKGSSGIQNSWIAGTFENAVVRYMGQPYWLKEGAGKSSGSSGGTAAGSSSKKKRPPHDAVKPPTADKPTDPPKKEDPPKDPKKEDPPKDPKADPEKGKKKDKGKKEKKDKKKKKDDGTIKIDLKKLKDKLKNKL